ncbi:hypothetical protein CALK_1125 [Chitinivibrio alkaliphilus ACht1]|uniref:Uncharacterized protein n=1 Tax=Chitinivibrio alkaliphilus ACht1 TaxID=1313304 RepID=U7D5X5_9BACT|nr:hypothetical protein CALK_1125 [Chitinivibrio alkaliphilus ACht1]
MKNGGHKLPPVTSQRKKLKKKPAAEARVYLILIKKASLITYIKAFLTEKVIQNIKKGSDYGF